MPFEDYDIIMYPPSQSFRPYCDGSSSEEVSVHGEDEAFLEKAEPPNTTTSKRTWRKWSCCNSSVVSLLISIITAAMVVILLLVTTKGHPLRVLKQSALSASVSLHGHGPNTNSHEDSKDAVKNMHCGSTPAEARSLGCKFDIMSFAWTPPSCYDPHLSNEFLTTQGPWTFYLDHNATIPLPFEELSDYDIVWTEHHYHVVHCLYAWERIHRASLSETPLLLPREMGSINHTTHCVGLLEEVEGAPRRKVNAIAYLVFDGCVDLN